MTSPGPGTRFPGDLLMAKHDLVLHRLPGIARWPSYGTVHGWILPAKHARCSRGRQYRNARHVIALAPICIPMRRRPGSWWANHVMLALACQIFASGHVWLGR